MIKSGYFPRVNSITSNMYYTYRKDDGFKQRVQGTEGTRDTLRKLLQSGLTGPGYWWDFPSGYQVKVIGKPTPAPQPKMFYGPKVRSNNAVRFHNAPRTNDIVVSDYKNIVVRAEYINGGVKNPLGPDQVCAFGHPDLARLAGKPLLWSVTGSPCYDFGDTHVYVANSGTESVTYEHYTIDDTLTPYDVGWNDEWVETLLTTLQVPADVESQIITDNLSEANRASLDILTTIAEMPETIMYIINLIKSCLRIASQAKKKEFSLLNKAKRIQADYEQRIFRVEFDSRQEYLAARNERARKIIENKRVRAVKQLRADLKRTLAEITSAIASVWLQFRYAIMPNVYAIEGALSAYELKETLFRRWSNSELVEIELPSFNEWKPDSTLPVQFRAFIKRCFITFDAFSSIRKELQYNFFLTAWELVPFSFVIDWFVNIGNTLSGLFTDTTGMSYKEGATKSLKVDSTVSYVHESSGARVNLHFKGYERSVIIPSLYCRLQWNPDLNLARKYDAAALSWSVFLRRLIKT